MMATPLTKKVASQHLNFLEKQQKHRGAVAPAFATSGRGFAPLAGPLIA
jgi:hypothetical protein